MELFVATKLRPSSSAAPFTVRIEAPGSARGRRSALEFVRRAEAETNPAGARQHLGDIREFDSVRRDSSSWVPFTGNPTPPTLEVTQYTVPNYRDHDDPIPNLLIVH